MKRMIHSKTTKIHKFCLINSINKLYIIFEYSFFLLWWKMFWKIIILISRCNKRIFNYYSITHVVRIWIVVELKRNDDRIIVHGGFSFSDVTNMKRICWSLLDVGLAILWCNCLIFKWNKWNRRSWRSRGDSCFGWDWLIYVCRFACVSFVYIFNWFWLLLNYILWSYLSFYGRILFWLLGVLTSSTTLFAYR